MDEPEDHELILIRYGDYKALKKAESEVERLRKLCADRPRVVQQGVIGMPCPTKTFISWVDKIDAAGREEGITIESSTSEESDYSALRKRIAELEEGLRQIAVWKQEDQDDHGTCARQWRGCVAIAMELLKREEE